MLMLFQKLYSARVSDAASWDRDCSLSRMRRSKWLRSRKRRRSLRELGQDWGHDSERSGPEWRLTTRPEARDQGGWGQGGGGRVEDGGQADSGDCGGGGLCRWHDDCCWKYNMQSLPFRCTSTMITTTTTTMMTTTTTMTTPRPPGLAAGLGQDRDQGQGSPQGQARALEQVWRFLIPQILKTSSRNFGKSSFRLLILRDQNQNTSKSLNSRRKETTSHRSLSQSTSVRLKMMSVTTFLTRSSVTGDGGGMLRVKNIMKCSFQISRV